VSTTHSLEEFHDILRLDEPLAPYTWLKLGGPAQFFLTPRDPDELERVLQACHAQQIPVRVLGSGSNLLVRDEGVSGAVIRLESPRFADVHIADRIVRAGAGALLSHVITETVRAGLAGLENLAGIPGTIGGAILGNAGGRYGDLGQLVRSVTVLTYQGERQIRRSDELAFAYRQSNVDDAVVLEAELELRPDDPEEIARRLRKIWVLKKSSQPLGSQSAGCIFKNPRGLSAGALIEQAGLKGTRLGGAEISDRHANFIVTQEGATSSDVLRLIDLMRSKVAEQFGVHLELEIKIW
jgi:UDP-N-acetylmuramate dehydrogenase